MQQQHAERRSPTAAYRQRRERKCPSGASRNISASPAMASWPPSSDETQAGDAAEARRARGRPR